MTHVVKRELKTGTLGPVDHELVGSLEAAELTILTCWAEAAETLAASPDQLAPSSTTPVRARRGAGSWVSRNLRPTWRRPCRTWPAWSSRLPRPPGRCWPQWTRVPAAAPTATWCAPSSARSSGGAGRVAEMAPRVRANGSFRRSTSFAPRNWPWPGAMRASPPLRAAALRISDLERTRRGIVPARERAEYKRGYRRPITTARAATGTARPAATCPYPSLLE